MTNLLLCRFHLIGMLVCKKLHQPTNSVVLSVSQMTCMPVTALACNGNIKTTTNTSLSPNILVT